MFLLSPTSLQIWHQLSLCPAWNPTALLLWLSPPSSVDYSFPYLHGMRYHIDASVTSEASERFGLSLNAKKTQVMVIGRHTSTINIMYNGAPLEQVKQFIYLGASFNEKGDTIKEVKRRVAIAKIASGDLHMIWGNRELPTPLKRKLVQLMIWPIMSYGSETWIYLQSVQNMINVFERWCYRRMLRIS